MVYCRICKLAATWYARPFIIAAGGERALLLRYRLASAALFALAVPLLCATLWAIATRFA